MRVVALISWYDESPTWLAASVASAARIADHVVAVDGAYAHYPNGRGSSGPDQSQAIRLAAEAAGVGCTIYVPPHTWFGDEVAKRGFMFRLGQLHVEPETDWFLVLDADEIVVECDANAVRHQLLDTDALVAAFPFETYTDLTAADPDNSHRQHRAAFPGRRLFRAAHTPISVVGQHWNYVGRYDGDDVVLWGRGCVDALELTGMRVEHRTHHRPAERRSSQQQFYRMRDVLRLEAAPARMEAHQ